MRPKEEGGIAVRYPAKTIYTYPRWSSTWDQSASDDLVGQMTSQDKSPDDLNSITKDDLNSITTRTDYSRILIVRATFCCFQKKYTCIPGASNVHKAHSYVAKYVKYRRIVCMTICLPLLVPCLPPCSWSSSSLLLIALLSPYCLLPLIPRILPECQPNVVILRAEIPRTV